MISVQHLSFSYPGGGDIFRDFSWQVERGQAWAVLGPSGCGKTTLLYMLAGLQSPSAGRVSIEGQTLERPRPATGLILQEYGLLPWTTVRDNLTLGLRIRSFYGPDGRHAPAQPSDGDVDGWLER